MNDRSVQNSNESAFIRRVIVTSLVVALILACAGGFAVLNIDTIRSFASVHQARQGNYTDALETAASISDTDQQQKAQYRIAGIMHDSADYSDAAILYESLGSYEDSQERGLASTYALADSYYQNGRLDEALEGFSALSDYSDSRQRQQQVIYQMAETAFQSNDHSQAVMLYLSIDGYLDSHERAYQAAYALTSDRTAAEAMVNSGGQTPEELEKSLLVAQRRALFPRTVIDAGSNHTVLLRSDGTVSACGDNTYGQCNVDDWRDIVQISAGANHTVGLRRDGSVVAVGDNTYGQCDVSQFSGIESIACADSDTYALSSSGQVSMCGYHRYDTICRSTDVTQIFAGSYSAVAMCSNSTFIPSHKSCSVKADGSILSLGLNTGYFASLKLDGTLSFSFDSEEVWKDIAFFDAGANAVIATDIDGQVHARFFRQGYEADFSSVDDAAQCAAGTNHYVFVLEDGTVAAFGDNTHGQCDVTALGSAF